MKNKLLYVGTFLLIAGLSASCTEEKDWSGGLKNSDLVFQTYLPTEGARGTVLSIRGNNFGEDVDQVQVWVNGKEAEVLSVAPTRISAKVAEESGSGVVKVRLVSVSIVILRYSPMDISVPYIQWPVTDKT
ncbi:IPT/TIG domain-containing protein [Bacteroides reticulotermitis]|uniref:IPT/TIG domain-containing protein n=1 Tax=Bacteroides reticulotermitis JCM 10512 TaxID=1445607 RepID=W4UTK6_9BACE|nr:IPT/TIG domain-containing protein [Bacteroides reticulotermitis]GAE83844.1 hypothetical protein JCM10512_2142 [Bacteroides reticulotermitis JCM 10512]